MKPAKRKLLVGIFVIVLACGGADLLTRNLPRKAQASSSEETRAVSDPDLNVAQLIQRLADRPSQSPVLLRRDPFTASSAFLAISAPVPASSPADEPASQDKPLTPFPSRHKLVATMVGARAMAVIDGQIFPLGGMIDGYRIIRIEADRVALENGGQRVELLIPPPQSKAKSQAVRD